MASNFSNLPSKPLFDFHHFLIQNNCKNKCNLKQFKTAFFQNNVSSPINTTTVINAPGGSFASAQTAKAGRNLNKPSVEWQSKNYLKNDELHSELYSDIQIGTQHP